MNNQLATKKYLMIVETIYHYKITNDKVESFNIKANKTLTLNTKENKTLAHYVKANKTLYTQPQAYNINFRFCFFFLE